eukprot:gene1994-33417_t
MSNQPNETEIVNEFQRRREKLNNTWNKITELTAEVAEHDLVLKALTPMDTSRKCFRLIGDVLVERTVGETMPAVNGNKEKLVEVITSLKETTKAQEKDLAEFQEKLVKVISSVREATKAQEKDLAEFQEKLVKVISPVRKTTKAQEKDLAEFQEKLVEVISSVRETTKAQKKDLAEFQAKYKLRVVQKGEAEAAKEASAPA